jgi:sugar phosphate isomerase/epimerase
MKLSVMLFPFHGTITDGSLAPEALLEAMVGAGIGAIEPMLSNLDVTPEPWQKLLDLCKQAGIKVSCVDIGANLALSGAEERAAALETVRRGLDLCVELDCPVALIAGSRPSEGTSNEEGRALYSQGLADSAVMAKERGVVAVIEDFGVYPEFACRSDHVREVVTGAGPEVKVAWDNGNFILADEMPMHAYDVLRDLTIHTHIKDFVLDETGQAGLKTPSGKAYKGADIGHGDCQVTECVTALKRDGFEGWVSLEIGSNRVQEMLDGAEFVKKVWDEA